MSGEPIPVGPDLLAEWLSRPGLSQRQLDYLAQLGVSLAAQERAGGLALMKVTTCNALFMPYPAGRRMVIVPVWAGAAPSWFNLVEDPWLDDLVAFLPNDPGCCWWRIGNGGILGADNYMLAVDTGRPITIHPHPLAWLRADCRGAAVLSPLDFEAAA